MTKDAPKPPPAPVPATAVPPDEPHADLWARYRAGDRVAYERLVDEYLPLVKATVARMSAHLPGHVSREDLYSAGCLGLVAAIERYDAGRDARFRTYAITRIRGAILDELRTHDVLGRVTRDRLTRIQRAETELESRGADAHPEAIAAAAGLTLEEFWDAEAAGLATRKVSLHESAHDQRFTLEETLANRSAASPVERIETEEMIQAVMDNLTDDERNLFYLYYEKDLTLKEIGAVLGVSESRVCQKHAEMTRRLRGKLRERGFTV